MGRWAKDSHLLGGSVEELVGGSAHKCLSN